MTDESATTEDGCLIGALACSLVCQPQTRTCAMKHSACTTNAASCRPNGLRFGVKGTSGTLSAGRWECQPRHEPPASHHADRLRPLQASMCSASFMLGCFAAFVTVHNGRSADLTVDVLPAMTEHCETSMPTSQ